MPRKKKEEDQVAEIVEANVEEKVKSEKSKKSKLEELKEKAKLLEKAIDEDKDINLKHKIKPEEEKVDTLIPIEDYLKSSVHLGTRVITPDMKSFVYKRRADGLAVFNTALLDQKIRDAAEFLSKFTPENTLIVCKREAGWKAVEMFSKITGIRSFTKKYPAGILTNPNLDTFTEVELVVICDPWIDKNALDDARRIKIPTLAVCDTNNYTQGITQILPGNNKSSKSLGMILYLLSKLYSEKRKMHAEIPKISEWIENWDSLTPPK